MADQSLYTNDVMSVLDGMLRLVTVYPTVQLTPDYLLMSIFEQQECAAHIILDQELTSNALSRIYNAYSETLSQRALRIVKPNRKIERNEALTTIIDNAEKEMEKLGDTKVTSTHLLLSLFNDDADNVLMKKVFNSAGVTYNSLFGRAKTNKAEHDAEKLPEVSGSVIANIISQIPDADLKNIRPNRKKNNMPSFNIINLEEMDINDIFDRPQKKKSVIDELCTNVNELVAKGEIDRLVGREKELDKIVNTLGRRRKNNCVIVGGDGVGKTALCYGLAGRIVDGNIPAFLSRKKILMLSVAGLVAGTQYRGLLEGKVLSLINELKENKDYILFIDDISSLFAEKKNADVDIASTFSSALSDGSIQVIGTVGYKGYRTVFDANPTLSRRFQKIVIEEPTEKETQEIMESLKPAYEAFHGIIYDDDVIPTCVKIAKRYMTERHLPDSAIDLFDEAGAKVAIQSGDSEKTRNLRMEILAKTLEYKKLHDDDNYDGAAKIEDEINKLKLSLIDEQKKMLAQIQEQKPRVTTDIIYEIASNETGIPMAKVTDDDRTKLLSLNDILKQSIIGQDEAIDVVCRAIKRNRIGLSNGKTMANLLLVGGTGLGKTLLAKQLAKEIFGDEKYLVRFDMSEYEDKTAVNKLIGSSAGYVGYENGGLLTETIKHKKYCVLLLDEFEKADPEIYNIFLQVFDEGYLSDNTGQKVDFKNIIILLTSNVGVKESNDFGRGIGFDGQYDQTNKILDKELKRKFSPEFLNRLDDIIYFNKFTEDNMKQIIRLELNKMCKKIEGIGHSVLYDETVVEYIYSKVEEFRNYGARPVIRVIQTEIENVLTDRLLENDYTNYLFNITCTDNTISIR